MLGQLLKRVGLGLLLLHWSAKATTAQTIAFSDVPASASVQCLSEVPGGLMTVVGACPIAILQTNSVGDVISLNLGQTAIGLALDGSSPFEYRNNIVFGYPGMLAIGDTVSVFPGGLAGPTRVALIERLSLNPLIILPAVSEIGPFSSVTLRGFFVAQILSVTGLVPQLKLLSAVSSPAVVTASGSCGGFLPVIFGESQAGPTLSCTNVFTRTWTATDFCGNFATATQTIVIADTTPPAIACPATVIVSTNVDLSSVAIVNLGTPLASDNCLGTIMLANNAPAQFPVGTTEVIWTATDACGNSATCTQKVVIVDAMSFRVISVSLESNDILLTWMMPLGCTGVVQSANGGMGGSYSNAFNNIGAPIFVPGTGTCSVTTNYLDVGAATNVPAFYYRVRLSP